jgi:hypothetical protein
MRKNPIALIALAGLIVVGFLSQVRVNQQNALIAEMQKQINELQERAKLDLVEGMGRMQLYTDKLYHAGKAGNTELVDFYVHELEEVAEDLVAAAHVKNGQNTGALIEQMLIASIEAVESSGVLSEVASFDEGYLTLINVCNACHKQVGYGQLEVVVPDRPVFSNQNYEPSAP